MTEIELSPVKGPLTLAGQYLEYSFNVKYLELMIHCHLSWHNHIENICIKV